MVTRVLAAFLTSVVVVCASLMPSRVNAGATPISASMYCTEWYRANKLDWRSYRRMILCQIAEDSEPIPGRSFYEPLTFPYMLSRDDVTTDTTQPLTHMTAPITRSKAISSGDVRTEPPPNKKPPPALAGGGLTNLRMKNKSVPLNSGARSPHR